MTTHARIAALLEPALGGRLDEVAFSDLVDEVIGDLAARFAEVRLTV